MTYRCVIIDDEDLARELIETHLTHFVELELVGSFSSAIEARTFDFSQADLLFLDIEMPVLRGTDFFKHLQPKPAVIFTTAYREYAVEGFDLAAVDYLLKPITFQRFYRAVERFLAAQTLPLVELPPTNTKTSIFVRKDRKQIKLQLEDIRYIESVKDYIRIHLADESHTVKHTLREFIQRLDERFLQVHRSFVVNKDQITAYTKHDIELGTTEIPVGAQYREVLKRLEG